MAIKINTAYKEILTSSMLNEKISGVIGGNEKVKGFDVSISTPTSVTVRPGKAYVNGCSIEETSETRTITLGQDILSNNGSVYVGLVYTHETKNVEFACLKKINSNAVKLATLTIKDGAITELVNHNNINTLNTVIGEAANLEAQKIRDSIPSGFIELGQLDYDYMANNENKVRLKSKSIAYISGYRVEIPANTVVDIGKAPEDKLRDDLLFLEAWKDSDFAKSGKLKWRIRHLADVNFDRKYVRGGHIGYIGWNNASIFSNVYAIGANPQRTLPKNIDGTEIFRDAVNEWYTVHNLQDYGLWIAGDSERTKNFYNTIDGYVYAIPMFRLYRKPSCGKSIPFEYSNINPKVDYTKISWLAKEEKVERVVTEYIQGRSLINLLNPKMLVELGRGVGLKYTFDPVNCILTNPGNNDMSPWNNAANVMNVIPSSGVFTLILENIKDTSVKTEVTLYNASGNAKGVSNATISPHSIKKLKIQTDADTTGVSFKLYSGVAPSSCKVMALEGDWTNKEIPGFFIGLKSLGEDDGNLITVKNGILSDDTYDINDGNQTLTTFSDITHVLSENTIMPNVEATTNKAGQKTALTKLATKIVTDGTETVEFTKIKGRTLQNCYPEIVKNSFSNPEVSVENGYIVLQGTGEGYKNAFIHIDRCMIKPNTKYTIVVYVAENTLTKGLVLSSTHQDDVFDSTSSTVGAGVVGTYKYLVTSKSHLINTMFGLRAFSGLNATGKVRFKVMLLEGDYTNASTEELPFVKGIESVGEKENNKVILTTVGKNLFNPLKCQDGVALSQQENLYNDTSLFSSDPVQVIPNSKVVLTKVRWGWLLDANHRKIGHTFGDNAYNQKILSIPSNCHYIRVTSSISEKHSVQIEYGETATKYRPYKEYRQNIYLKNPLRGFPDGTCDEIRGNKVIRKVGRLVVNGSEAWNASNTRSNTILFGCQIPNIVVDKIGGRMPICDKILPGRTQAALWSLDIEGISYADINSGHLRISILKSKLPTQDREGFKTWLSQHPLTIYYELQSPIEESLENVYEKESIKTYQLDAPLRSLPSGVKDEIKDGVLIRRCGEAILNEAHPWRIHGVAPQQIITQAFHLQLDFASKNKSEVYVMSDKFVGVSVNHYDGRDVECMSSGSTDLYSVMLKINRTKIGSQDMDGFKKWLAANPIKIIYERTTPIETPLIEATPQTANFSLKRQFEKGNWLRELPNGVKDTIEGNKVIRRVGKVVLNGSESWTHVPGLNTNNTVSVYTTLANKKPGIENFICDKFMTLYGRTTDDYEKSWGEFNNTVFYIRKLKSTLNTPYDTSLKTWLSKNPVTVLYELAQPTEEALTNENYMLCPCHDFNTYCGNMYIGERRNNILLENTIPNIDPVVVKTDFRTLIDRARLVDCRYKKCDDGYSKYVDIILGKNLFNNIDYVKTMNVNTNGTYEVYKNGIKVIVNGTPLSDSYPFTHPTGTYTISYKLESGSFRIQTSEGVDSGYVTSAAGSFTFSISKGATLKVHGASGSIINNIQLEAGRSASEYEECILSKRAYENTEKNDVEDLRHRVSLSEFNYDTILNESFDKLLRGEL